MLKLYYSDACPYCQKILIFLKENSSIEVEMINVLSVSGAREELAKKGGQSMIPALSIDDKIMYESVDIYNWLQDKYAK
jgi:glutathione S-transferase